MRERLLVIRERRARLVADAEAQRERVFAVVEQADRVARLFDRARDLARRASAHPVWIAAGVALVVALRPRGAIKLAATGVSLWRGWRSLRAAAERFAPVRVRGALF